MNKKIKSNLRPLIVLLALATLFTFGIKEIRGITIETQNITIQTPPTPPTKPEPPFPPTPFPINGKTPTPTPSPTPTVTPSVTPTPTMTPTPTDSGTGGEGFQFGGPPQGGEDEGTPQVLGLSDTSSAFLNPYVFWLGIVSLIFGLRIIGNNLLNEHQS